MTHKRFSLTPATAIAVLALFFALGGTASAVAERTGDTQQRVVARAMSAHSFDEALTIASRRVPRALRKNRLQVRFEVKVSNPHIAEYWAFLTSG